jgi:hypothetical protein
MAYLLAAQDAVTWQQRGSVTSAVGFFRTMGGAVGIGVLGAVFNLLIRDRLVELQRMGIKPAQLLDPHGKALSQISPQTVVLARSVIGHGLLWVFGAMVLFSVVGILVTLRMPRGATSSHRVSAREGLEALAG